MLGFLNLMFIILFSISFICISYLIAKLTKKLYKKFKFRTFSELSALIGIFLVLSSPIIDNYTNYGNDLFLFGMITILISVLIGALSVIEK